MDSLGTLLNFAAISPVLLLIALGMVGVLMLAGIFLFLAYGKLWLQAYTSGADVTMTSLVGMFFRQVNSAMIVRGKVMARQAGLSIDRRTGISTARLEAHYLAGGNIMGVIVGAAWAVLGFDLPWLGGRELPHTYGGEFLAFFSFGMAWIVGSWDLLNGLGWLDKAVTAVGSSLGVDGAAQE